MAQLQARPDQGLLEALKDILQYATPAWLDLFAQLGGLSLLLLAAEQHTAACRAQQQQQQADGGSGGGSSSAANLAAMAGRSPAADALAAAMECVAAMMGRSGGDRLLVKLEPRWVLVFCPLVASAVWCFLFSSGACICRHVVCFVFVFGVLWLRCAAVCCVCHVTLCEPRHWRLASPLVFLGAVVVLPVLLRCCATVRDSSF